MVSTIEKRAKRRIKRFIKTGKPQARVRHVEGKLYEYKVKHHITSLFYKADVLGRLRRVN